MTADKILMVITITESNWRGNDFYYRAHVQDSRTMAQRVSLQPPTENIESCIGTIIDYLKK